MITKQLAESFLRSLEQIAPYVPPMQMQPLGQHPVVHMCNLIAAGQITLLGKAVNAEGAEESKVAS